MQLIQCKIIHRTHITQLKIFKWIWFILTNVLIALSISKIITFMQFGPKLSVYFNHEIHANLSEIEQLFVD